MRLSGWAEEVGVAEEAHGSEEGQNGVEVQEEICKGPRREI